MSGYGCESESHKENDRFRVIVGEIQKRKKEKKQKRRQNKRKKRNEVEKR